MRLIHTTCRSIAELVSSWWSVDRIRISPHTGRLLSIRAGERILMDEAVFTVQSRETDGGNVTYQLLGESDNAELTVCQKSPGRSEAELRWNDSVRPIFDDDVVILSGVD